MCGGGGLSACISEGMLTYEGACGDQRMTSRCLPQLLLLIIFYLLYSEFWEEERATAFELGMVVGHMADKQPHSGKRTCQERVSPDRVQGKHT